MSGHAEELAAWIRLEQTRGVGPDTARRLLSAFGLPEGIFRAGLAALRQVVSERIAQDLSSALPPDAQVLIDRTLEWSRQPGNRVLTLADPDYPPSLLQIADPPLILYVKGRHELLSRSAIAIVGSRNATGQGAANARQFAESLSQAGLTVISGMALGIDTAAHEGALRAASNRTGGSTVAVIGTGADIVYPARNRELAHRIAAEGCIVSEYSLGTPAVASNFPRRNRIISGLASGVLVVEAAAQSGSLITARMALDQGRDVFAIPGSIHSPLSKGCHLLIKQGAKLVESASDILDELKWTHAGLHASSAARPSSAGETSAGAATCAGHPLLDIMGFDPIDVNTLAETAGLDMASVNAQLLTLELDGKIEMLPGSICRRLVIS